jgi:hypothetical protein
LEYWKDQARSLEVHLLPDTDCKLFVFTDQPEETIEFAEELTRIKIQAIEIPSYGWPDATLLRYKLITSLRGSLNEDDVLMYLDSDMLAVSEMSYLDFCQGEEVQVTLVRHPGYFRPQGLAGVKFYLANPKIAMQDIYSLLVSGGVGSWETRRSSNAYIGKRMRRRYFCGGIWWGPALEVIELSEQLAQRIDDDSSKGIVAIWHDESHLNWWATQNHHNTASPEYCFSSDFPALRKLQPKILAVDKGNLPRV